MSIASSSAASSSASATPTHASSHNPRHKTVIINNSTHEIYTDDPRKLSDAAIYANKKKYGIYTMPGYPTLGVTTSSSSMCFFNPPLSRNLTNLFQILDEAAILANKSDLSLKLWQHKTSDTGLRAASFANSNQKPVQVWKPSSQAAAATAAISAKSKTVIPQEGRHTISGAGLYSSEAALTAHAVPGPEAAAKRIPDAYSWNERKNSVSAAGLAASSTYSPSKTRSSSTLAFTPNGLDSVGSSTYDSLQNVDKSNAPDNTYLLGNIAGVEELARKNASATLSKIYLPTTATSNLEMPMTGRRASTSANSFLGASAASYAANLSHDNETERVARQREASVATAQQYESVMVLARERAQSAVDQIDKDIYYKNPLMNTAYYEEALAIAQKNGSARLVNHGKIDVGGGLFITQSDVDAIAERNVRPVLVEISEKAAAQRQADEERRIAEEDERKRRAEEKRLDQEKKDHERRHLSEQKAAAKAIRNEEIAQQQAIAVQARVEEKERRDVERKKVEEERAIQRATDGQTRSQEKSLKAQERAKIKAEKLVLLEAKRKEKHALKVAAFNNAAAAARAREAQFFAHREVQRTQALQITAESKLEQAKLAEAHASSEAQAEQARAETVRAEAELAAINAKVVDAEAIKAQAEAEKAKADAEVHEAVVAQKDLDEKLKDAHAQIAQLEAARHHPVTSEDDEINKEVAAEIAQEIAEDEAAEEKHAAKADDNTKEILAEAEAAVDAEKSAAREAAEDAEDAAAREAAKDVKPVQKVVVPAEEEVEPVDSTEDATGIAAHKTTSPGSFATAESPEAATKEVDDDAVPVSVNGHSPAVAVAAPVIATAAAAETLPSVERKKSTATLSSTTARSVTKFTASTDKDGNDKIETETLTPSTSNASKPVTASPEKGKSKPKLNDDELETSEAAPKTATEEATLNTAASVKSVNVGTPKPAETPVETPAPVAPVVAVASTTPIAPITPTTSTATPVASAVSPSSPDASLSPATTSTSVSTTSSRSRRMLSRVKSVLGTSNSNGAAAPKTTASPAATARSFPFKKKSKAAKTAEAPAKVEPIRPVKFVPPKAGLTPTVSASYSGLSSASSAAAGGAAAAAARAAVSTTSAKSIPAAAPPSEPASPTQTAPSKKFTHERTFSGFSQADEEVDAVEEAVAKKVETGEAVKVDAAKEVEKTEPKVDEIVAEAKDAGPKVDAVVADAEEKLENVKGADGEYVSMFKEDVDDGK